MYPIYSKQSLRIMVIINLIFSISLTSWAAENSDMLSAKQWIDSEIYGTTGKQFGEIDDLVIRRSGKVKRVAIEVGGFLGFGDKLVSVTPKELQNLKMEGNGKMVLNTTEKQMEKRPEFSYYRENLRPDYYYRPGGSRRHGYGAYPPPFMRYRPYGPQPWEDSYHSVQAYEWAFSPSRYLASAILYRKVINENGAFLGTVDDLLIDANDFTVKKIVLWAEDIRGDDPRVAIPYKSPGFAAYGIVWDFSREEIRNLPSYDE